MSVKKKPQASVAAPGAEVNDGVTVNVNGNTTQPEMSSEHGESRKHPVRLSYTSFVREIVRDYVDSLDRDDMPTLEQAENELSNRLFRATVTRNSIADKEDKWPIDKVLPTSAVAACLVEVGNVHPIMLEKGEPDSLLVGAYDASTGAYDSSDAALDAVMNVFGTDLSEQRRKSILRYVVSYSREIGDIRDVYRGDEYNKVGNGWYNRETGQVEPNTPERVSLYSPTTPYDPDAENPVIVMPDGEEWDIESAMLDWVDGDEELADILWQGYAAMLRPNAAWNKALFLYATEGSNGKGTYVRGGQNLMGSGACMKLSLEDFGKRFRLHGIGRVPFVFGDENNPKGFLQTPDDFKAAVTGDILMDEMKNVQPVKTRFHGLIVQCLNRRPAVNDPTESYLRRVLPVKFEKSYTGVERKYIKEDYMARPDVLTYIMKRALEMDVDCFSMPDACKRELALFDRANNNVTEFAFDVLTRVKLPVMPQNLVYCLYKGWLESDVPSAHAIGKNSFYEELHGVLKRHGDALGWQFDPDGERQRMPRSVFEMEEPLFEEYGLGEYVEWKSPKGASQVFECTHKLKKDKFKDKYALLVRTALPDVDDTDGDDDAPDVDGPGGGSQNPPSVPDVPSDAEYVDYDPDEGGELLRDEYEAYLQEFDSLVAAKPKSGPHGPARGWRSKGKWHMQMYHPPKNPGDVDGWFAVDYDEKPPEADDPMPYGCWLAHRLDCPAQYGNGDGFKCDVIEAARSLSNGNVGEEGA